jgi:hypothetical protein
VRTDAQVIGKGREPRAVDGGQRAQHSDRKRKNDAHIITHAHLNCSISVFGRKEYGVYFVLLIRFVTNSAFFSGSLAWTTRAVAGA